MDVVDEHFHNIRSVREMSGTMGGAESSAFGERMQATSAPSETLIENSLAAKGTLYDCDCGCCCLFRAVRHGEVINEQTRESSISFAYELANITCTLGLSVQTDLKVIMWARVLFRWYLMLCSSSRQILLSLSKLQWRR